MSAGGKILENTIDSMFAKNSSSSKYGEVSKKKNQPPKTNKRELELAATVLLVDLASCDQGFEQNEYHLISSTLRSIFGTSRDQVQALVNQANVVLKNLRGTSYYAALLKENLEPEAKRSLIESIDELISADGHEDGFEIYTRKKIAASLGVELIEK